MRYMGGKFRVARPIANYLMRVRRPGQMYWEPFLGMASIFRRMANPRVGTDLHCPLIALHQAVQGGWVPPTYVSEAEYNRYRFSDGDAGPLHMYGFVGFNCSFGGRWFSTYARDNEKMQYAEMASRDLVKMAKECQGAKFACRDYRTLKPKNCLIYADPPYTFDGYSGLPEFDIMEFWEVCKRWVETGNKVYVSHHKHMYRPEGVKSVWEREMPAIIYSGSNTLFRIEQLLEVTIGTTGDTDSQRVDQSVEENRSYSNQDTR